MDHLSRSLHNAFTGLTLNRKPLSIADEHEWHRALHSERARFVIVRSGEVLCDASSQEPVVLSRTMLGSCEPSRESTMLLGDDAQHSYFSINVAALPDQASSCLQSLGSFLSLRQQVALLTPWTASLLGYACFAASWHGTVRFCNRCGHPLRPHYGTPAQVCTNPDCATEHYPRVNPAMIVLVHRSDDHDDWCLMGRQSVWRPRMYSALAGYIEPGESAEDAVVREVAEETGVVVDEVRYYSSQPWPFSGSLMLGYHAVASSIRIALNDQELEDARWFSRSELQSALRFGEVVLPGRETIARHLFDAWYGGMLPS